MPRFLSCHQKGLQRSQGACFWTRACLFLAGMGSFPCKPLPDPWVPRCTSPSKYDFLVCRKVLSWDKPSASSPTLARYLDGRGDPGLVHSRRSGGGEGGTSHPQYFSQAWGGGPCSHTCLAPSPFPGDAGCGWERGRVSPLLLSQQATRTHWCTCPLMSPPVLTCFCLFSASESLWEQSSDWNKGDLQMEIWPSPSGSPSPWGPSVCSGLGGGDRGICDLEGVKGWLHLSRRGTVSWEGGLEKGRADRQAWLGKASWRKRYLN